MRSGTICCCAENWTQTVLTLVRLLLNKSSLISVNIVFVFMSDPILLSAWFVIVTCYNFIFENSVFMSMEDNTCNNNNCELPIFVNLFIFYYY